MSYLNKEEILSVLAQTAVSGDIVQWDGTNWVNVNFPINLTGIANGDILVFNGTKFVPSKKQSITESTTAPVSPILNDLWNNSGTTTDSGIKSGNLAYFNGATWERLYTYSKPVICSREITIGGQSLSNGGVTKIAWNGAVTDTHSAWSVANNHFVAPENGLYLIYFRFRLQSTTVGTGNLSAFGNIYINGLQVENTATFSNYSPSSGILVGYRPHGIGVHGLSAGDMLDIRADLPAYHTSATINGGAVMQKLKIIKIGEL